MNIEPKQRQIDFMKWRFGMFIHFGAYTWFPYEKYNFEKRLGDIYIDPNLFNPDKLDCESWVKLAKQVGFKYIILTVIHQDNFCLWQTKTNSPSVKTIKWENGKRDIVQEYVDACRKYDMKIGFYYNFCNLNNFGEGINEYIHLDELLNNYGKIDYLFFDGYGSQRKPRDYKKIAKIIRTSQPEIILSNGLTTHSLIFTDGDPDVGWIGNEEGNVNGIDLSPVKQYKCINDKPIFSERYIIPSSYIRLKYKYWFYSKCKEDKLKTVDELINIYNNTYKKNIALVINVSPNRHGLIPNDEKKILLDFSNRIKE